MTSERDIHAISTWEQREDNPGTLRHPEPTPYRCTQCDWTGKGSHRAHAHALVAQHLVVGVAIPYRWDGRR